MGLGSDVGKNAGVAAVQEAHKALDGAIPEVEKSASVLLEQFRVGIVEATGSLERAAGAIVTSLSYLPEQITSALDGMEVDIKIKISRKGQPVGQ